MKLFNTFALTALAFGMNVGSIAGMEYDVAAEFDCVDPVSTECADKVAETVEKVPASLPECFTASSGVTFCQPARRGRELQTKFEIKYCVSSSNPAELFSQVCYTIVFNPPGGDSSLVQSKVVECPDTVIIPPGVQPPYTCTAFIIKWRIDIVNDEGPGVYEFDFSEIMNDQFFPKYKQLITDQTIDLYEDGGFEFFTVNYISTGDFEVSGDPHFKTWGGKWFDFMGECDMKLLHAPHFDGEEKPLDIDVRTKIRYDYSYVESAALKLGNDTLEVASFGDYFLNGVEGAAMPAYVGGYPVTHTAPSKKVHVFEISLSETEKVVVKTFKDLVAVTLNEADSSRFIGSLGMSGSFDKFGKMIGRDGETEFTDPNAFANEWQIREDETSLFNVAKGPQHPEQCKLPKVSTSDKRRRLGEGLARERAERACAHFSGENFENCVFDVMAIGDVEIAQAGVY